MYIIQHSCKPKNTSIMSLPHTVFQSTDVILKDELINKNFKKQNELQKKNINSNYIRSLVYCLHYTV